jgi:1-phosphatidylinositol-4-phosphate 5-kinase
LKSGDGSEYSGEFKKGLAHGKGEKRFPDRTVYAGEFKDGDANGKGTFTDKFKNKFTGLWKDGKLIKEEVPKK